MGVRPVCATRSCCFGWRLSRRCCRSCSLSLHHLFSFVHLCQCYVVAAEKVFDGHACWSLLLLCLPFMLPSISFLPMLLLLLQLLWFLLSLVLLPSWVPKFVAPSLYWLEHLKVPGPIRGACQPYLPPCCVLTSHSNVSDRIKPTTMERWTADFSYTTIKHNASNIINLSALATRATHTRTAKRPQPLHWISSLDFTCLATCSLPKRSPSLGEASRVTPPLSCPSCSLSD